MRKKWESAAHLSRIRRPGCHCVKRRIDRRTRSCNDVSGLTDGYRAGSEPDFRGPLNPGGYDPQPHAAAARPPRADGVRAVRRAPAAAVDGQPPPESAGRCGLGRLPRAKARAGLYTMALDELRHVARRLWLLVREQVGATAAAAQDQRRLQGVAGAAPTKSQEFFSSPPGQWDQLREELFGDRFHLRRSPRCSTIDWTVGDLGCGTGQVSAALAPFVARVIAVDASAAMLQAAKKRLHERRQRRAAARRSRGAADRRWAARCGDADAGAAPRAGAASARSPKSRAC